MLIGSNVLALREVMAHGLKDPIEVLKRGVEVIISNCDVVVGL